MDGRRHISPPEGAPFMNDLTTEALTSALHGLSMRQRVIANNIANIQTPGYLARKVDFESSLQRAFNDGDSASINGSSPTVRTSLEGTRTDGNNVNLDDETIQSMQTNMRYQATVEALNHKFKVLRTAIGGGR
jgi:flagellar basal-body rod protein FlgB